MSSPMGESGFLYKKGIDDSGWLCKNFYYYGRVCGLGKGKIAPVCTRKGDGKKFTERVVTFSDLIPDFLVTIFPVVGGIILSIFDFSLLRVGLIIVLMVWSVGGTAVLRSSLVCTHCKQREIGCPAQQFFSKKKD
ncbi:MAG: hypothetical protein V1726_08215 [Methanobacteriota archaeon]